MTVASCPKCNGECIESPLELLADVGEYRVKGAAQRFACTRCRHTTFSGADDFELRAIVVAFKGARRVSGAMLRSARKALYLTQGELAKEIGAAKVSVCRWECEAHAILPWVPVAVLGLVTAKLVPPIAGIHLTGPTEHAAVF